MEFSRPRFEVADVIRLYGEEFLHTHVTSLRQRQVLFRLEACRTAKLGGHADFCPSCDHAQTISYNSCRDRHCPKCQGREREQWIERSLARILPIPHFHVVFTLPHHLSPLILAHPRPLYDLLFQSSARALLDLASDPRHLGAMPGFVAVLHTWAQNLVHHPHLHCIVTAGGLSPHGTRWIHPRKPGFLLPVKALGKRFRRLFLRDLARLAASGRLGVIDPTLLDSLRTSLRQKRWVVYAKRPFRGPAPLFRYLGRYTHRIGFANPRLLSIGPDSVCFTVRARDPFTGNRKVRLPGPEFLRRLLLHVLPKGFVRIRHYGLYATTHRASRLARARPLLAASPVPPEARPSTLAPSRVRPLCPVCGHPLTRRLLSRTLLQSLSHGSPFPLPMPILIRSPPHVA